MGELKFIEFVARDFAWKVCFFLRLLLCFEKEREIEEGNSEVEDIGRNLTIKRIEGCICK